MKTFTWLLTCIVSVTLWGCSNAEGYPRKGYDFYQIDKVAVVDVIGQVGGDPVKNQIADFFVMELLKRGYSPIGRPQVQNLLHEYERPSQDITSKENVAWIGAKLKVPVVMFVNVPKFDNRIAFSVKMVDVEDGDILWMGTAEDSVGKPLGFVGATADAIVGVVSSSEDDAALGDVVVADGDLLSHQQEKVVRALVSNLCKTIPIRR